MKSHKSKATKPCARIRTEKILKKIDRLTIQLEDTNASIQMITDAINDEEVQFRSMYASCNAEHRLKYEQETKNFESRLQERLDETTKNSNEKEKLSDELETLMKETKVSEENITNDRMEQLRKSMEAKIEREQTEWKRGQKKRESEWMSERVKEVRRRSLQALQPQIQKLLHSHKVEIEQVKKEFITREECTKRDTEDYYQKRITDYKRDMDGKAKLASEKRKEFWRNQLHQLQKEHSIKIRQMTNRDGKEEKEKWSNDFKEEINTMTEKQSAKLELLQQSGEKHIERVHREFAKKLEIVRMEYEAKTNDLQKNYSKKKEKIKSEKEVALRSQFEAKMISTRQELINARDNQIDEIIRSFQEEETAYENDLRCSYKKARQKSLVEHNSTIDRLQNETFKRKQDQLNNAAKVMQTCSDELEFVQMKIYKAQGKNHMIDREEEKQRKSVNPKIDILSKSIAKSEQNTNTLQKDIEKLIEEMTKFGASNKQELDTIEKDHKKRLESLELEVKNSIAKIEKDAQETEREIARNTNRVEKLREILVEYHTVN